MSRFADAGGRLYRGEVSYNFVGQWRRWYAISAVVLLISIGSIAIRGLDLGIEFKGGAVFSVPTATGTVQQAQDSVAKTGIPGDEVIVTEVNANSGRSLRIQTPSLANGQATEIRADLSKTFSVQPSQINAQVVGPSWGDQITKKAVRGLIIFLIFVTIFLSVYFEWKMALAALVALVHDLVITVGIYALTGLTVTPATVIGVLTILGYSLYDTVVVFDKVKENARGLTSGSRMTYSESANLAVNQTLVRSINTSIIALLPVGAILFVGAILLGAGTLKDLSLALFIGLAAGTYSSIFIAVPLLCQIKEREPAMQALQRRVEARRSAGKVPAGVGSRSSSKAQAAALAASADELSDGSIDPVQSAPPATTPSSRPSTQGSQRQQPRKGGQRRPPGKKRR
jgi:preprotein translocase subunit SecF